MPVLLEFVHAFKYLVSFHVSSLEIIDTKCNVNKNVQVVHILILDTSFTIICHGGGRIRFELS